ncbi:HAMP domain-containing protein [Ramlibacter sp. USB13]|uniref:histidine kinase n=1 Tax=Ramlibacter cellulosilyticus TaxID=2764187 RepID=A0A923SCX9_9BURK|nr:ATP-binding protein [Ramlibacter cellulosilyticus]MBC5784753.1 HAMP domain-containing protein [Ramlibacter cellulosilyticus]
MSLRLKINLIVAGVITLGVLAIIALQLEGVRRSVREEMLATNRVTVQLLYRVGLFYAGADQQQLVHFFQQLGRVRANEITVADEAGEVLYRSPPSTYKQGREAPEWFSALMVPKASRQVIVLPGTRLTVEAEPSRAVLDGWDDMVALATAGAGLLLAINVLVFWAVGRAVQPFSRIVQGLNRLEAGDFDTALPPLSGKEAGAIGTAFNRMLAVLKENMDNRQRAFEAERRLSDTRELARLIEGRIEAERHEIARALHDELGQSVTAIRSLAQSVALRSADDDGQAAQAARLISEEAARLYDHMHGMIPRLAPMALDHLGLAEALDDLVERVQASQPAARIELEVAALPGDLREAVALVAYRVVQEGLTNALRHGRAHQVRIHAETAAGRLAVGVEDDGLGVPDDWRARGHFGLRWLTERAEALGGSLAIARRPGGGTELRADLPLAA